MSAGRMDRWSRICWFDFTLRFVCVFACLFKLGSVNGLGVVLFVCFFLVVVSLVISTGAVNWQSITWKDSFPKWSRLCWMGHKTYSLLSSLSYVHPTEPLPSLVMVILASSDLTYIAVHCWRSCISGGWKPQPPLEQSAARRHLSSIADCFSELPQNLSFYPIISFLTVFGFYFCIPCIVVV